MDGRTEGWTHERADGCREAAGAGSDGGVYTALVSSCLPLGRSDGAGLGISGGMWGK